MEIEKLIISTSAFSRSSLSYTFARLKDAGITRISLWGGVAHGFAGYPDSLQSEELRRLTRQHHIEPVEFVPEILSYPFNPADDRVEVRNRTCAYYRASADFCAKNGIPRLLLHPGVQLLDRNNLRALRQAASVLREVATAAAGLGLQPLLLHGAANYARGLIGTAQLLEEISDTSLLVCLDAGRLLLDGEMLSDARRILADRVTSVRISAGSNHRLPMAQDVPLRELMQELNTYEFDGSIVWEFDNNVYRQDPFRALCGGLSTMQMW